MVVWTLIIRQNMAVKRVLARSLRCVGLCYFREQNTQTSVLFSVTFTMCFHVSWQVTLCCGLVKRYLEDVRHCDLTLQSALVSTRRATSTGSSPDKIAFTDCRELNFLLTVSVHIHSGSQSCVCVCACVPARTKAQSLSRQSQALVLSQSRVRVSPHLSPKMSLKRDYLDNGSFYLIGLLMLKFSDR